ncbi:uncharacterized protein LOC116416854 [Nasonia vitripennis]|uniref:Uncharacterized protein n=1 Tax=Nasonia vitripennis TaxID=7425 RepID=A0A7M7QBC4_NASVI|nr:uncharacterized protein LOC116416850 [Nasonia vitripennis]XP_031782935.1 uncharacterized protein LOC116416854 [Nasonia vitripennis]
MTELVHVHNDNLYPPRESLQALARAIVTEFPILKNPRSPIGYIDDDFESIFAGKGGNLITIFLSHYVPRIINFAKACKQDLIKKYEDIIDDSLRALLILADFLSVSNAVIKQRLSKKKKRKICQ